MSKSEKKIQETFLNLLASKPIESISVSMLCNALNMERQTFYYHYQSLYDLIYSIFYEMKLEIDNNSSFKENIFKLQTFLENNRVFCISIINTFAESILTEFINSYYYRVLKTINYEYKNSKDFIIFFTKGATEITLDLFKTESFNYKNFSLNLNSIFNNFSNFIKTYCK
ncbi:MAG TPA: hypothetical protein DD621_04335 [Clostridiales bacterium]|nr:hypothetical protein [Clostridiales bacterium]